jgi:hypothetical protein
MLEVPRSLTPQLSGDDDDPTRSSGTGWSNTGAHGRVHPAGVGDHKHDTPSLLEVCPDVLAAMTRDAQDLQVTWSVVMAIAVRMVNV